jgi:transposase-like protein
MSVSGRRQPREAGDRLFTFTRLPISQWKTARTTKAIERLHEGFKRRIKTQTMLPSHRRLVRVNDAALRSARSGARPKTQRGDPCFATSRNPWHFGQMQIG